MKTPKNVWNHTCVVKNSVRTTGRGTLSTRVFSVLSYSSIKPLFSPLVHNILFHRCSERFSRKFVDKLYLPFRRLCDDCPTTVSRQSWWRIGNRLCWDQRLPCSRNLALCVWYRSSRRQNTFRRYWWSLSHHPCQCHLLKINKQITLIEERTRLIFFFINKWCVTLYHELLNDTMEIRACVSFSFDTLRRECHEVLHRFWRRLTEQSNYYSASWMVADHYVHINLFCYLESFGLEFNQFYFISRTIFCLKI